MNEYIKLIKIDTSVNPEIPTPEMRKFAPGEHNPGASVPISYWVTGWLLNDVEVGRPLIIERNNRNGVVMPGIMNTSAIQEIELFPGGLLLSTINSIYRLEWLNDESSPTALSD